MKRRVWIALAALCLLFGPFRHESRGQDRAVERKIAELEGRIRELEATKAPTAGDEKRVALGPPTQTDTVLVAGDAGHFAEFSWFAPVQNKFKDGFIVSSADNRHQLRLTGQIQADLRVYPRHGDFTDNDTFLVRRARLGIEATVFDHYEFRFLPDWGSNRSIVQDAYVNVHYWDELQFQMGKFKEPVSYEQLIQDRFVPTLERSLIDQIVPARDVGIMFHGQKVLNNHFDYAVGIFNGAVNTDVDTNKLRDVAGRIAWRPFVSFSEAPYFSPLQVGISGTIGKEQEALNLNGTGTLRTPGNIPWLAFNSSVRADGVRTRLTPEVSYFYNSLGFAAQYMRMDQEMRSGVPATVVAGGKVVSITNDPVQNIRFDGYQFMATYLLTGEKRTTYSAPVVPLRPYAPLSPFANPGAWELVARVSHLQVNPSIFRADPLYNLAKATGNSNAATELSVGFNWYLNSHVRMQFNWEHAWFQQPLLVGQPSTFFPQTDAVLMRFQIIF